MTTLADPIKQTKPIIELEGATVRFAGDSGDGMQLVGGQFTTASVLFGNDVSTLPDYPAEIRAPAGTLAGVSGFQINFSRNEVYTPGDKIDALFAMNPAALKVNLPDLYEGGWLIVNSDAFTADNLERAHYSANPLEDGSLKKYRTVKIPITAINMEAMEGLGLDRKTADRCKNFFTLGLALWLYDRPLEPTLNWIQDKFVKRPAIMEANTRSLKAGYHFGETAELFTSTFRVNRAKIAPGRYCKVSGNEAVALGLITASKLAKKPLFYASYPITPASEILQELSAKKAFGVTTFQAEDEIASMCAVVGAAYGGALAVTGTSGPGLALKMEAINLALMVELPSVIVNVQRGGPSTGLPTKTEQADLLQSIFGRNGECPVPIVAASTPADCFNMSIEACRIALKYMTPVILLSDGYLANGAEPLRIPEEAEYLPMEFPYCTNGADFQPYLRNELLVRPWAIPGTPGLEHRIGGLEKQHITGGVSYDPNNHEFMVKMRRDKVLGIQREIPPLEVFGESEGELLVVGWGSTYGVIRSAVDRALENKKPVSFIHLRYLFPYPPNLGSILSRFKKILVPEMNLGQLLFLLRAWFFVDAVGLHKVKGKPFQVHEISEGIDQLLEKR